MLEIQSDTENKPDIQRLLYEGIKTYLPNIINTLNKSIQCQS